jgi:hypothetical protein
LCCCFVVVTLRYCYAVWLNVAARGITFSTVYHGTGFGGGLFFCRHAWLFIRAARCLSSLCRHYLYRLGISGTMTAQRRAQQRRGAGRVFRASVDPV